MNVLSRGPTRDRLKIGFSGYGRSGARSRRIRVAERVVNRASAVHSAAACSTHGDSVAAYLSIRQQLRLVCHGDSGFKRGVNR